MTKNELKTKWSEVLEILPNYGLDQVLIGTFFMPLSPLKLSEKESTLYLFAPYDADYLKGIIKRHQDTLVKATNEVFGSPYICEILDQEIEDEEEEKKHEISKEDPLDPTYTFESFVQGPNNRLAYVVSAAVADGFSKKYNPLFIYASSGLGKTHLLHAIGHYVMRTKPKKKVLYVSSETFKIELIEAIRLQKQADFKKKYQTVDYLLFDDVQFISQNNTVQEELFNTFEALYKAGKQIVFASDRPPKELGNIPERLTSRFAWGMPVDIQLPEYETRMAILKNKAILEELDVNDENLLAVLDIIAKSINTNIRDLEGAFKRVFSYSTLLGEEITVPLAKKVLSELFTAQEVELTPEAIKKYVASYYGVKVSDLESPVRSRNINYPRQIAIYLIRTNTNLSFPQIGELFGGRDHSTIMNSYEKISNEIKTNKELSNTIDTISRKMKE